MRHLYDPSNSAYFDELSLWLIISDDDGNEDISEIFVAHDTAQLSWHFDASTWHQSEQEGENEIGLPRISMPASETLPLGRYKILVQDKSGKQDELFFSIEKPEENYRELIPTLSHSEGSLLMVQSPFSVNYLFTLIEGKPHVQRTVASGSVDYTIQQPLYIGARYKNRFYLSGPYHD